MLLRERSEEIHKSSYRLQVTHEQDTAPSNFSKAQSALPLKWPTEKSVCVEQWPLTSEDYMY